MLCRSGGQRSALKLGDPVHVGDTVDVAAGAKLKLRMNDGSVIAAASGTRLTIDELRGRRRRPEPRRQAVVERRAGARRRGHFQGAVAFRGRHRDRGRCRASTDWFIDARPGATQIGVLGGSVSLTSRATGKAVDIPARWGAGSRPVAIRSRPGCGPRWNCRLHRPHKSRFGGRTN